MTKIAEMTKMNKTALMAASSFPISIFSADADISHFDRPNYFIFPGFCDVHVHFREPGFSYKETIKTGSLSAARGGYTDVCTMPNLNPVPDSVANITLQRDMITRDACIGVHPLAAITVGEKGEQLADIEGMAPLCIGYSDDGRGVQSDEMMREAMQRAKALGKMIVAHCEVNDLLHGGYIHDGEYAKAHGHRGICSESEWAQIARDIELVREIGCRYHVCHISTKESVEIIRKAKAEGVNITCETGPHYLVMDDSMLQEDGRFKMNPPIRAIADRDALVEGLLDGTVDMIATDHAPHSAEEKSRGLEKSAFGIVGLETALPVLYTKLVKTGLIPMERVVDALCVAPRKRFEIPFGNDFSIWEMEQPYTVDPDEFQSMGRATPFTGETLFGRCVCTVRDGHVIWQE